MSGAEWHLYIQIHQIYIVQSGKELNCNSQNLKITSNNERNKQFAKFSDFIFL